MRKVSALATIAAALVLMGLTASSAAAAPPFIEHTHFTSEPFTDNICGIDVIGVVTVSGFFLEFASGASVGGGEATTVLTNPESGKSITFKNAGVSLASAPIDNGDGTSSVVVTVNGLSPKISELNGPPLDGIDTGSITLLVTFDTATGEFISADVLNIRGPRPAVGCDLIVAALT
jgi:hypothetical protein